MTSHFLRTRHQLVFQGIVAVVTIDFNSTRNIIPRYLTAASTVITTDKRTHSMRLSILNTRLNTKLMRISQAWYIIRGGSIDEY